LLSTIGLADEFAKRQQMMTRSLEDFNATASASSHARIAQQTSWFRRSKQLDSLVDAIQAQSRWNNFDIQISRELLAAYVTEQFVKHRPVRDCILETAISGQSVAQGHSDLEIIQDASRINLTIVVKTCAQSRTVGVNGPVNIYSDGLTYITTKKSILFDGNSILAMPAVSNANTNSTTRGLSTKFTGLLDRVVKKVAYKQIGKKKSRGDAIAADHAEIDTNVATDMEIDALVREGNAQYYAEIKRPQSIRGIYPERYDLSSEPTSIHLATLMAGAGQLGAPFRSGLVLPTGDVRAQVHQSCVNNLLVSYLAGKTLSVEDLEEMLEKLEPGKADNESAVGALPTQFNTSQRKIAVTLDTECPVEVIFEDQAILLTIRAQSVQIDSQVYSAMNITLRHTITMDNDKWVLMFDGQPIIAPPRLEYDPSGKLSGPEIAVRRILRNAIARDLPRSTVLDSIPLTRDEQIIGMLHPSAIGSQLGWLGFAANYAPKP
jgi:hypothetical protein